MAIISDDGKIVLVYKKTDLHSHSSSNIKQKNSLLQNDNQHMYSLEKISPAAKCNFFHYFFFCFCFLFLFLFFVFVFVVVVLFLFFMFFMVRYKLD